MPAFRLAVRGQAPPSKADPKALTCHRCPRPHTPACWHGELRIVSPNLEIVRRGLMPPRGRPTMGPRAHRVLAHFVSSIEGEDGFPCSLAYSPPCWRRPLSPPRPVRPPPRPQRR